MLTFNDLLALERIDTAKVRLVRHHDSRLGRGRMYEAWRNDRAAFESYQSVQSRDRLPAGDLLAGFVVIRGPGKVGWQGCDLQERGGGNRFASWTGTAPLDASSGQNNRHRLSRARNRRMNHVIHIAAISQIRLDTDGRAGKMRVVRSARKRVQGRP